ncbi:glycoside hydrolase family 3 N-terminal domain-containing protein [Pseudomonas typographi]|uniref:glycoside hydrolase family 3 N-terminal domain-containing protein n=1 Tax=Pseudomonas typographi TaxID=2715964 RepID=UPI001687BE38|nr:glycoside hydrolase family 3 N-terminal domain-containing protein [Pseudomonas typographi]MBD1554976.1 glycoside hydrolase family 3 protein [Pseudomonas typographi]
MPDDLSRAAYSVLLPAFSGLQLDDTVSQFLRQGGVSILLGETREEYLDRRMSVERRNSENASGFRAITDAAGKLAGSPILVAVDQELGGIERLHKLVPTMPTRPALHELSSEEIEAVSFSVATAARGFGVNLFLAPIVDVVTGPNPWLTGRDLGTDAAEVARISCAFIAGVQRAGVIATAKHFPGHYLTEDDPAIAEACVPGSLELLEEGIDVFRKVIGAGVKAIMPGPAMVTAIDPHNSASTSPAVIAMLRDTLSFDGLIISDDLDAVSISRGHSVASTAVASLAAGAHLLLLSSEAGLDNIVQAIVSAVEAGALSAEVLLTAAQKVRSAALAAA